MLDMGDDDMLIKYINKAMSKAMYEKLEDGSFGGKIPECPGVMAFAPSLDQCQEELRSVLEGWIIVKLRHGDTLTEKVTFS
jgi:predicted RNase H-like HicB family nuclease